MFVLQPPIICLQWMCTCAFEAHTQKKRQWRRCCRRWKTTT